MRIQLTFFSLLLLIHTGFGQDSLPTKRFRVLPVPAFGYSPETKAYIGAVAMFTIDPYEDTLTRTSNAKAEFNYTWMKQLIAEAEWNFLFREEKWFSQGLIHYSRYPDSYFGIGAETTDTMPLRFSSDRVKIDINGLKNLGNHWFAGPGFRYINYYGISADSIITYNELQNVSTFGFQMVGLMDKRNNLLTPTSGSFFRILNTHNWSESYYSQISADYRYYFTFGKRIRQTVSSRIFSQHILGVAPFYDLALLGGDKLARGYFYGRFREVNLTTIQAEYRASLFWRIGLSAFGGISTVYSSPVSINKATFKPNAGIGFRFLVDRKEGTNLRFDYAVGLDGQTGFYVSFGESF